MDRRSRHKQAQAQAAVAAANRAVLVGVIAAGGLLLLGGALGLLGL